MTATEVFVAAFFAVLGLVALAVVIAGALYSYGIQLGMHMGHIPNPCRRFMGRFRQ